MPEVMFRKGDNDQLIFYVAKKDLEETVVSLEFQQPDKWGGEMVLSDGQRYYLAPLDAPPKLPITLRVKRAE
ncbi:MAG: putative nitrogen fixation protein NifT [Methylococcaceae bacterium]|nr:MAG: putative nitrogen fixation protein NifT [Methylococcaceae bacterium]